VVERLENLPGPKLASGLLPDDAAFSSHPIASVNMPLTITDAFAQGGYDSDDVRDDLADSGIEPVIPPRSTYKRRNLIERCVNRLKQFAALPFNAMHCRRKALDQNRQHGLVV